MNFLYIFEIDPLSVALFANVFSHSEGCLFVLLTTMCVCAQSLSPGTLCNPMDCMPPDPSVHGILQARILDWVAIFSSRKPYSRPRDLTWTCVPCVYCIAGGFFTNEIRGRRNTNRNTGFKWDRYRSTYFSSVNPTKLKTHVSEEYQKKKKKGRVRNWTKVRNSSVLSAMGIITSIRFKNQGSTSVTFLNAHFLYRHL